MRKKHRNAYAGISLNPFRDIVLLLSALGLLLPVHFISASPMNVDTGIPVKLKPVRQLSVGEPDSDTLLIAIDRYNRIYVNNRRVSVSSGCQHCPQNPIKQIIIQPHYSMEMGKVVELIDAALGDGPEIEILLAEPSQ